MDLDQIAVGTHEPPVFPSKALKLKQVDNHNIFVQRIQTNCSKLEDPTLNFDLELHENDINSYQSMSNNGPGIQLMQPSPSTQDQYRTLQTS